MLVPGNGVVGGAREILQAEGRGNKETHQTTSTNNAEREKMGKERGMEAIQEAGEKRAVEDAGMGSNVDKEASPSQVPDDGCEKRS